jgi:hypothetical protein
MYANIVNRVFKYDILHNSAPHTENVTKEGASGSRRCYVLRTQTMKQIQDQRVPLPSENLQADFRPCRNFRRFANCTLI